jgi:putative phage-type endonuclease
MPKTSPVVKTEAWHAQRRLGIGGSDVAAVFNEGYGCKLRLWRQKRNEEPDFPNEDTDIMQMGVLLEQFFADKYAKVTRRNVITRKKPIISEKYPFLRVNIDRQFNGSDNGTDEGDNGVLEIKSVGRGPFYKYKREGMPHDYLLQMHHGILVTDWKRGAFALGCRDNGDMVHWDVQRDEVMCDVITAGCAEFWHMVVNDIQPERLDPADRRCQRCEYRTSCQGSALIQIQPEWRDDIEVDNRLLPVFKELVERKKILSDAEALVEETEEVLKTELGDRQAVETDGGKVYWRPQDNSRGDFKQLAPVYDELLSLFDAALATSPELFSNDAEMMKRFKELFRPSLDFMKRFQTRPLRLYEKKEKKK